MKGDTLNIIVDVQVTMSWVPNGFQQLFKDDKQHVASTGGGWPGKSHICFFFSDQHLDYAPVAVSGFPFSLAWGVGGRRGGAGECFREL